jgi:hypothetical protein
MSKYRNRPALAHARLDALSKNEVMLSTGVRARIRPVSATMLDEISSSVPEPAVPKQFIEAKGRDEYNPLDPAYQQEVKRSQHLRGMKTTEALIMFGIELVDPLPDPDTWLPKLRYLEKRGTLDLSRFNLEDPFELELVFKLYLAVASPDLMYVSMASGLTEKEVAEAVTSFPSEKARRPDSGSGDTPPA